MRSHNIVIAALAALTDLGAVAAPVNARGVNDANDNPSSLQILSNKIPSNFRLEASALVLPSPEDRQEASSQGTGVEITRTGNDEDETVLRTHDVVPLGRAGSRNRTSTLTRPLLAGAGGQANPFTRGGGSSGGRLAAPGAGGAVPFGHHGDDADAQSSGGDGNGEAETPAQQQQQQEKRADGPLAGVQDLPGEAIKLSNAPVPPEVIKMQTEAMQQAGGVLPGGPTPAGAVAATQDVQEMPAAAMAAAGGMIPEGQQPPQPQRQQKRGTTVVVLPAADIKPATAQTDALGLQVFERKEQDKKQKRGTTGVELPAVDVKPATAQTDALGLQVFERKEQEQKQKRGDTSVTLPALHMDSATVKTDALGVQVFEKQPERRDRENTAEGCRRHAAEMAPANNNNNNNINNNNNENKGATVLELRPVAQVEPVASLRPAADVKLPNGAGGGLGLARTLGLQRRAADASSSSSSSSSSKEEKRQVFVNIPRPRPRPSDFLAPIVVAPQVRPVVGLQRRQVFVNVPRPRPRPAAFFPAVVVAPQVRPAVGLQRRTMRRGVRTGAE